jgi:hypothetical protein
MALSSQSAGSNTRSMTYASVHTVTPPEDLSSRGAAPGPGGPPGRQVSRRVPRRLAAASGRSLGVQA